MKLCFLGCILCVHRNHITVMHTHLHILFQIEMYISLRTVHLLLNANISSTRCKNARTYGQVFNPNVKMETKYDLYLSHHGMIPDFHAQQSLKWMRNGVVHENIPVLMSENGEESPDWFRLTVQQVSNHVWLWTLNKHHWFIVIRLPRVV